MPYVCTTLSSDTQTDYPLYSLWCYSNRPSDALFSVCRYYPRLSYVLYSTLSTIITTDYQSHVTSKFNRLPNSSNWAEPASLPRCRSISDEDFSTYSTSSRLPDSLVNQNTSSTGAFRATQMTNTRKLPNGTCRTATVVRDH
jgi:hypothetical protein